MSKRNSDIRVKVAIVCAIISILCLSVLKSDAQKKNWQAGTILEVKAHQPESDNGNGPKQYDISVKVGKKIYLTLYAAEKDEPEPDYYVGMRRTVLVEGNTLKFNDLLGHTHSVQILKSSDSPSESK